MFCFFSMALYGLRVSVAPSTSLRHQELWWLSVVETSVAETSGLSTPLGDRDDTYKKAPKQICFGAFFIVL